LYVESCARNLISLPSVQFKSFGIIGISFEATYDVADALYFEVFRLESKAESIGKRSSLSPRRFSRSADYFSRVYLIDDDYALPQRTTLVNNAAKMPNRRSARKLSPLIALIRYYR